MWVNLLGRKLAARKGRFWGSIRSPPLLMSFVVKEGCVDLDSYDFLLWSSTEQPKLSKGWSS